MYSYWQQKRIIDLLFETGVFKNSQRCRNKACRKKTIVGMVVSDVVRNVKGKVYELFFTKSLFKEQNPFAPDLFSFALNYPPEKLMTFVFSWSAGIQVYAQSQFSGLSEQCAVRWDLYLRDVCSTYLIQNPVQFGGRML